MIPGPTAWDSDGIFEKLSSLGATEDFSLGLSIRDYDPTSRSIIGVTDVGQVFFGGPQEINLSGFVLLRAELDVNQEVSFSGSLLGPVYLLKIFAEDEDDLLAVSSIFAGLFDLQRDSPRRAALAAQAYLGYFADIERTRIVAAHELGLFGELVVIMASVDVETMVKSWHSSPYSTYDFSLEQVRLEVKTSKSPQRIHWLRHSQSGSHSDVGLTYMSVYCPEAASGETVRELIERITAKVNDDCHRILLGKLEAFPLGDFNSEFDYSTASTSLKRVPSMDVPSPKIADSRIMDVHWKVDFSRLDASAHDSWEPLFA
jgi:hypothetical protein